MQGRTSEQARQQEGAEGGRWLKCPTLARAQAQAPDVPSNGIVQAGKVIVDGLNDWVDGCCTYGHVSSLIQVLSPGTCWPRCGAVQGVVGCRV